MIMLTVYHPEGIFFISINIAYREIKIEKIVSPGMTPFCVVECYV
jgi:hypothetical protein